MLYPKAEFQECFKPWQIIGLSVWISKMNEGEHFSRYKTSGSVLKEQVALTTKPGRRFSPIILELLCFKWHVSQVGAALV